MVRKNIFAFMILISVLFVGCSLWDIDEIRERAGKNNGEGTDIIPKDNEPVNQNPAASDFDIGNLTQTAGSVVPVTVTPKAGKSTGAITIFYNGSTTLPVAVGTYAVTFNVAAATGWNAATGLAGGILTINPATTDTFDTSFTVTFADFEDVAAAVSAGIIYLVGGAGKPTSAAITVGSANKFDAGSIKWYLNRTPIIAGISGIYGETLTVSSTTYNSIRQYSVMVEVKIDGKPYSKIVTFEVKP